MRIQKWRTKCMNLFFITKNGCSDPVVMNAELYDRFTRINRIDQAIYEAEKEVKEGAEPVTLDAVKANLDTKCYG